MDLLKGNLIHVGVAEWKTARDPDALITTLGSCVGIVLYSAVEKAGGLAHILLAESPVGKIVNRGKYATSGIAGLISDLKKLGLENGLKARIFGGASMFDSFHSSFLQNIGMDNVKAVRQHLEKLTIPIITENVGGTAGRTITIYMDDGRILYRANQKEKYLYKV